MNDGDRTSRRRTHHVTPGTPLRVLVALVLAVGLAVAVGAAPASAHSTLARSDPPDGGMVAVGRSQLSLWFDEPIDLASSRFLLRTSDGTPVRVTTDPSSGRETFVQLRTAPLERGVLVLEWDVASAVDGHVRGGSLTFGVGVRPDPVASGAAAPRGPEVAVRWLLLTALMVAVGAVITPGLLNGVVGLAPHAPQQALRLGLIATLVGLVTSLVAPAVDAAPAGVLESVATERWAQFWVLRVLALLAATAAFARLSRRGVGPGGRIAAGVALVLAAVADAASGHAAGLPRASAAAVLATTVHVLAAGAWVGTLAVLAICLLPLMQRQPSSRRPLLTATWRSFGPVAAVAATLVVASGLYLAGRHLPDLSAVASRWYGVALAGKVILLAIALAIALVTALTADTGLAGALQRRGWLPRAPVPARFPRLVVAELSALAGAAVLAAVMTTVPTARATAGSSPAPGAGSGTTATVDGLFVTFEAVPAGPGETRLVVRVNAVTRPQPGPVTGADVLLVGASGQSIPVPLQPVEPGHFEGATETPTTGDWRAWVSVHRPSVQDAVAEVTWSPRPIAVAGASGLEVATTILASLLGLAAVAATALMIKRRRVSTPGPRPTQAPLARSGRTS